tara:strand:+ start:914 stop:1180 length:267 start_codon:yes stop_codon:yes gene_type:complete
MNYISFILVLCLFLAGCGGTIAASRAVRAASAAAKAAKLAEKLPANPKPKVIIPEAETGSHNGGKVVIDVGSVVANEPLNQDSGSSSD